MSIPHPRPWLAAVLSLFFSPLGFLYTGHPGLALLFFVLTLGCRVLAFFTSGGVTLAASLAEIALWIAGVVLAWWLVKSGRVREGRWYSRWYGIAGAALAVVIGVYASRLFFYEPFLAPSGAMLPTAGRGDRLLVRKLGYGSLSVNGIALGHLPASRPPARGELVVFTDPVRRGEIDFKRVAGIGGDEVLVHGGRLWVNGRDVRIAELGPYDDAAAQGPSLRMRERLGDTVFDTLVQRQAALPLEEPLRFPLRERCTVSRVEIRCTVPPGYLFVLGDHRDSSQDSRYYGFVRANQVLGKVVGIFPADP